jgi:hypothetical protein
MALGVWSKYPNSLFSRRLRLHHATRFGLNFTELSPILIMHVRRLGRNVRKMDWKQLLRSITTSVDKELRLRNAYLVAENRLLRQQIPGRVQLMDSDRKALAELGQKLGQQALAEMATIAKPDTILAWHRTFADQPCAPAQPHKAVGRPRIDKAIEDLVVRMARENRSWGYDRIVGALTNLGYTISDQTVGNILKRQGIPPASERKKTMTWREFIRIHMDMQMATDFFTSTVWSWCRFVVSFLLIVIAVCRYTRLGEGILACLKLGWRLLRSLWPSQRLADGQRWRRGGIKSSLSRLVRCGDRVRRLLLSAFVSSQHPEALPQRGDKVVRIAAVTHRPIRDGPLRSQPQLDALRHITHHKAA